MLKKFFSILFLLITINLYGSSIENLKLNYSWNLVGITIDNVSPQQFMNIVSIWSWDNGKWKVFTSDDSLKKLFESYKVLYLDILNSGNGYWINTKKLHTSINLTGIEPATTVLNLSGKGWFLAGLKGSYINSIYPEIFKNYPVNTLWKWNENSWEVWSTNQDIVKMLNKYNIPQINEINFNEGFWINYSDSFNVNLANENNSLNTSNIYSSFLFAETNEVKTSAVQMQKISGKIQGIGDNTHELMFSGSDGSTFITPISDNGSFQLELPPVPFAISLLNNGKFETAAFAEKKDFDEQNNDNLTDLVFNYENGKLNLVNGNFATAGESLIIDNNTPVGLEKGNKLFGLTPNAYTLNAPKVSLDADRDGVPDLFDVDSDGDGIIDSVDNKSLASLPVTPFYSGFISGAKAFTNLKIDPDANKADTDIEFMYNDYAVVTVEILKNDINMIGYTVDNVSIVRMPNWSDYGFSTSTNDWEKLNGSSGPAPFDGYLEEKSDRWEVFLKAPIDNGTLSSMYPEFVKNGGRIPLTFDFNDNMTKPMLFILKISYRAKDNSTMVKYSMAPITYTFRTPPLVEQIITDNGTCNYNLHDPNGCGHTANPVNYYGSGDIVIKGLPPKIGGGGSVIMWGAMKWKATIFYTDEDGNQIGSINPEAYIDLNSPGFPPTVTVDHTMLNNPNPAATDINGDGVDDMYPGHTWAEVKGAKIDFTAETLDEKGGNAAMFIYINLANK